MSCHPKNNLSLFLSKAAREWSWSTKVHRLFSSRRSFIFRFNFNHIIIWLRQLAIGTRNNIVIVGEEFRRLPLLLPWCVFELPPVGGFISFPFAISYRLHAQALTLSTFDSFNFSSLTHLFPSVVTARP